ncbi:DNA-binding transcriptional repressor AcrR [Oceanobacillus picturae]|uniref:DNA-binding transcriptional repressor AcrR n=1 Tax=Oceanobacillus picturae TaxID=171693 RepID=W9ACF9_9BACI|nr:TetR/AcrR family transcriptional regulator [Oceanobacillus picturae]RIU94579.1 TetR/AcrR family transcriptional regulator [Oceanobacillus picturae]GAQ18571.1 DNA-binding transcriptional repressor AcrR [Oceanobacillus picturae]CDO03178.1 DNA-binding transcriptional repressor AcrR [Oceanobacillus picturae]
MSNRGRKKGSNGERSREQLLTIAARQFANNGFFETKVSSIVKEAGLTQPTFYLYFKSKEAIFTELAAIFKVRLLSLTEASLLESGLKEEMIKIEIKGKLGTIFRFFKENPDLTQIGFFLSEDAKSLKSLLAETIYMNLVQEQKDGYFHPHLNMQVVSEIIVGIMERLTISRLFTGLAEPEELAEEVVELLLFGMQVYR